MEEVRRRSEARSRHHKGKNRAHFPVHRIAAMGAGKGVGCRIDVMGHRGLKHPSVKPDEFGVGVIVCSTFPRLVLTPALHSFL